MDHNSRMRDVIRQIYRDHGPEAMKNRKFVLSVFMDMAPMMRKEIDLLRIFLECDGAAEILSVTGASGQVQQACMTRLVKKMEDAHWVSADAARFICAEFFSGVTGREWNWASASAPQVNRNTATTQTERSTYSSASSRTGVSVKAIVAVAAVVVVVLVAILAMGRTGNTKAQSGGLPSGQVSSNQASSNQASSNQASSNQASSNQASSGQTQSGKAPAASHTHTWRNATCTEPKTCTTCGATSGTAEGHNWTKATFAKAKTCTVCKASEGSPLDYSSISVEKEVEAIREKYGVIESAQKAGNYRKENVRKGVNLYYDSKGSLVYATVSRGTDGIGSHSETYSRFYYFSNGKLFFAFFEGSDSHRLYFYDEMLMRWRYTAKGASAVNYDFTFTADYSKWENLALSEIAALR